MSFGTSVRNALSTVIANFGNSASLYNYVAATKASDDEGKKTVSDWKTASTIYIIPESHDEVQKLKLEVGDVAVGEGVFWVDYSVAVAKKDKITYNSLNYSISEVTPVIANSTILAKRIVIGRT